MRRLRDMRAAFRAHHLLAWATALCGALAVLGVLYFFAAVSVGESLQPMYDPVTRTISELAVGRYGWLQVSAFVALGLSLWALPAGMWRRVRATVSSRLGLVLLVVCGASSFVAAAFPTDLRGAVVATVSGDVHEVAASVGYACLISAMLLFSWHFRRDHSWRHFHPVSTALTVTGLAVLIAMAVTGESVVAGLLQRTMAATLLVWVALAGVQAGRLSLAARPARSVDRAD
ncbi:MAG TPA: DUF998 domain-containing protein [Thermoleophilia bacterium]|nr:DUF998 domain-containing protein [Thermoleophilia bacterium]